MADLGPHGLALLGQFEPGPGGKPATEAYECSGGRYTLGLGATSWPNGTPIGPNDFCTPEQAVELTNWHLRKFSKTVDRVITRPMTTNQRDAFIMLAFNIGEYAFEFNCSAARLFNEGVANLEVAAAFGKWCKATNDVPDKTDLDDPYFMPVIGRNAKGQPCWVDAAGRPCDYQKAMPGLLRRHLSEACLFLDLDWRQACTKKAVSIICDRVWDDRDNRWEDIVRKKTELADVLPLAKQHPLNAAAKPAPELILTTPAPSPPQAEEAAQRQPAPARTPAAAGAAPVTIEKPPLRGPTAAPAGEVLKSPPPPPAPIPTSKSIDTKPPSEPVVIAPKSVDVRAIPYGEIDVENGAKNMTDSQRAIGMVIVGIGSVIQVVTMRLGVGTAVGAIAFDLSRDPVVIALAATAVAVVIGWLTRKRGTKVMTNGMVNATQVLK